MSSIRVLYTPDLVEMMMPETYDEVESYRQEIDAIDTELLRLLNRRGKCALAIGRVKKAQQLPIHVPEREVQIIERLNRDNAGPLPPQSINQVFTCIFAQMRGLEQEQEP